MGSVMSTRRSLSLIVALACATLAQPVAAQSDEVEDAATDSPAPANPFDTAAEQPAPPPAPGATNPFDSAPAPSPQNPFDQPAPQYQPQPTNPFDANPPAQVYTPAPQHQPQYVPQHQPQPQPQPQHAQQDPRLQDPNLPADFNQRRARHMQAVQNGQIIINQRVLTPQDIAAMTQLYRIQPRPGAYWYDPFSGLFGVVGFQAYGFMHPGHREFGPMDPNCSAGNTGVFINGRHIRAEEYVLWCIAAQAQIPQGRYWFDHLGRAGVEGSPVVLIDYSQAAQRLAGRGGGGDNIWHTRWTKGGNFDNNNSRGYVNVPGHGPIGYGFD